MSKVYSVTRSIQATRFSMTEEYTGLMSGLIFKSIPDLTESFDRFADGLKSAAERATT